MRISFLLHNAYGIGGTIRSTFNLAATLAEHHDVEIVSVLRHRDVPTMSAPANVRLTPLVDLRAGSPDYDGDDPHHALPARVFPRADGRHKQYSRLTDERIGRYLSALDAHVIVGTRPGLNVHIARQAHSAAVRVGQEHLTLSGHGLRLRHEIRHRYQLLDAVTTVTESDAHAYRRLGLPSTRVEAIPNSVPAASAEPADGTGKVVVAAGRLTPAKRYDLLVRAFARVVARHPDWQLRIFGSGDATGNERESLAALIGELGLSRNAHLMGNVDPLEPEWAKGSIAVSTSDQESFGMTIVEAMRCGLPVVSTDCPVGPREIIEDGVDGRLVRPGDADGIAAALLALADDAELRRRMGEAALANSARFDPARIAERHLDLYRDLLRRGPGRRSLGPARETAHRVRIGAVDTAHALRSTARGVLARYRAA
ncbi:glycosyltransferase family 4 protein [Streptomyces sp. NBC_00335]|uniref:glycosyltransferase family 4 protein n=1 Tax=unclassified Streptomyces TaxID=2593676 RepID=UPI00224ED412|nr:MULTISPECIES: glycosyltransferase family 4 protein [unclassified Streptomyces]MCX5403286.1 glycosyltransferase family 4 protein [Streptomyces sp. NBC_00086]